jgi:hypothetical protein
MWKFVIPDESDDYKTVLIQNESLCFPDLPVFSYIYLHLVTNAS